jgi:hypothetical protein
MSTLLTRSSSLHMDKNSLLAAAAAPLCLTTYDGSAQCVHPDVIRVGPHFYGRELLMVMEPYPYGDDYFENPSLLVSDDGLTWSVPDCVSNPIVDPPPRRGAWNSDGDLLLDNDHGLSLYYRFNSGQGETTLFRKTSTDGVRWSEAAPIFTVSPSGSFASPALLRSGDAYHMYYVDTLEQRVHLAVGLDGIHWTTARIVFAFANAWHVDAMRSGDWVYLLLNDKHSLFLLRSADERRWSILTADGWRGYRSDDAAARAVLLGPSEHSWDDDWIYRSTFLIENGRLRLWYGAKSKSNEWRVGYTDGALDR